MSPKRAREAAKMSFRNVVAASENCYQGRCVTWLDDFVQDVRFGLRSLAKHRSFTVLTVLSLALGIGACTAIFSLVNAVLLRSLPYGDADKLVYVFTPSPHIKLPPQVFGPSVPDFIDLQRSNHSFESMTLFNQQTFDTSIGDEHHRVGAAGVDGEFFHVLQTSPQRGRLFDSEEMQPGGRSAVIISDALWHSAFNERQDVIGQVLHLDGKPYEIIGVMPDGFGFPHKSEILFGNSRIDTTQLWLPYIPQGAQTTSRDLSNGAALARLRNGVTAEQAQAELAATMKRLSPLHRGSYDWTALVEPLRSTVLGRARSLMFLLLGAIGFVLLVASGNAANLFLARAANRMHELSMRIALGARRGRLLRQMLTESLILSSAAAVFGAILAWFLLRAMLRFNPGDIPRMGEASLDLHVLGFLVFVTLTTGFLFGALPSFVATRVNLTELSKSGGARGVVGDRRRIRNCLAIVQIALVVVLLTGTSLLARSFIKVTSIDPGFSSSTITATVEPNRGYDTAQKQRNLTESLLERIKSIQGVESAGMIDHLPLTDSESLSNVLVEGYANESNQLVEVRNMTSDYLSAMQIPLLAGRSFSDEDGLGTAPIAIVNEAFARKFFGTRNPVGMHLRRNVQIPWATVVGLIGNVRIAGLEAQAEPQIYYPFLQNDNPEGVYRLAVRSTIPKDTLIRELRSTVHAVEPALSLEDVYAMGDLVSQAKARRRFQTTLLTAFSGIAMLLALVGVYGLLAYSVRQRRSEIGIRIALGSSRGRVVRMVLQEGLTLLGLGLAIGMAMSVAVAQLLAGLLYGVHALDPITFAAVPIVLLVATLAASLVPCLRAATVDPIMALRNE
jgi:predicted permease